MSRRSSTASADPARASSPPPSGPETWLALTTAPGRKEAERLAEALVGERLAACINILSPIRSVYRWRGEVEREDEALLLMKTTGERLESLRQRLLALHSYDTPEFLACRAGAGDPDYLRWITDSVG